MKSNSILGMGLKAYLDKNYTYRGDGKQLGGYQRFVKMVDSGFKDGEISEHFGPTRTAIAYWRQVLEKERKEGKK